MTARNPLRIPPWPPQDPAIPLALQECFESGEWGQYPSKLRDSLTLQLSQMHGSVPCRLLSSGSVAMELALRVARIDCDDEVVVAAFDFPGNFRAIECVGAKPVLVDVNSAGLAVPPEVLTQIPSGSIKAVIVSHLHGHIAPMSAIAEACRSRGWLLIEDACQAIGMKVDGKPIGAFSDLATLSFGGSKLVSAGCGGALLLRDKVMLSRFDALAFRPSEVYPMSSLQMAVAKPQLNRLDEMNRRRAKCVDYLIQNVAHETDGWRWLPSRWESASKSVPAYYKLAFLTSDPQQRDRVIQAGQSANLPLGKGFHAMHRSSERRCRRPVALPNSKLRSECLVVLDHRALLVDPDQYPQLAETLIQIHEKSSK